MVCVDRYRPQLLSARGTGAPPGPPPSTSIYLLLYAAVGVDTRPQELVAALARTVHKPVTQADATATQRVDSAVQAQPTRCDHSLPRSSERVVQHYWDATFCLHRAVTPHAQRHCGLDPARLHPGALPPRTRCAVGMALGRLVRCSDGNAQSVRGAPRRTQCHRRARGGPTAWWSRCGKAIRKHAHRMHTVSRHLDAPRRAALTGS